MLKRSVMMSLQSATMFQHRHNRLAPAALTVLVGVLATLASWGVIAGRVVTA